jgi:hypothetical protein
MLDAEKCKRCFTLCEAWYGRKFPDLVKRRREKAAFKAEFDEVSANLGKVEEGEELSWPCEQDFYLDKYSGSRTEVTYWFLTVPEFHKLFHYQPTTLGMPIHPWNDQHGSKLRGVFLRPSGKKPDVCRRVKFFYESSWKVRDKTVDSKHRLRLRQADDAFTHTTDKFVKENPKEPCSFTSVT